MRLGVCYVCPVVNWPQFEPLTRRFLSTSVAFPAEQPHEFHVVCNGGAPNTDVLNLFSDRNPVYHQHDNTGWDIGAFQKVAAGVDCDLMLFLGTNTHFKRAGWLHRLMEAREQFGPGLYGPSASFDICPHIRTTAFMCDPKLVRAWKHTVIHPGDRHKFEVGADSLTTIAHRQGLPRILVTWDGFYEQKDWRKAPNLFRRGDQSNCLIYDRHHELYEAASPAQKIRLGRIADGNKFEFYRSAIETRLNRWLKPKKQL